MSSRSYRTLILIPEADRLSWPELVTQLEARLRTRVEAREYQASVHFGTCTFHLKCEDGPLVQMENTEILKGLQHPGGSFPTRLALHGPNDVDLLCIDEFALLLEALEALIPDAVVFDVLERAWINAS